MVILCNDISIVHCFGQPKWPQRRIVNYEHRCLKWVCKSDDLPEIELENVAGTNRVGSRDVFGVPSKIDTIESADAWEAWIYWVSGIGNHLSSLSIEGF